MPLHSTHRVALKPIAELRRSRDLPCIFLPGCFFIFPRHRAVGSKAWALFLEPPRLRRPSGGEGEKCLSTHLKQQPASPPLRGGLALFTAAEWREGEDKGAERTRGGKTEAEAGGPFVGRTAGCETAKEERSGGCAPDCRHGAHLSRGVPVQSAFSVSPFTESFTAKIVPFKTTMEEE